MPLSSRQRREFDEHLEQVLSRLPRQVLDRLDEVPLIVEDRPSPRLRAELGVRRADELCGLYTGVPLTQRSVEDSGRLPDHVTIFREGILAAAADARGRVRPDSLQRQIRITILHEVGHHFGLSEEDLQELGYD